MAKASVYEIINRKRRGENLTDFEIESMVTGFTWGGIPDYQMAALLMAIAINGMDERELAALMRTMLESGEQWNLRDTYPDLGDKHSTGGVGDKISLVVAPWVASCGGRVGMLSGRGLGHTGGTLDRLEAIPGFNAQLTRHELERCLNDVRCAISTSTEGIAPADRKLYALRDVTATVESIPLITASIMAKKLALGAAALILDVKVGNGAFMRNENDARDLARHLIAAAEDSETRVEVMITRMNSPLGRAVGNANEVAEAFATLRGEGPADIHELARAQGIHLLVMTGHAPDAMIAAAMLDHALESGAAIEQTRAWIDSQGGDAEAVDDPSRLPQPRTEIEIRAPRSGFIAGVGAYAIGMLGIELGAGRHTKDDVIDPAAGIVFEKIVGDMVANGEVIARLQLGEAECDIEDARRRLLAAVRIEDAPPPVDLIIVETMS